MTKTEFRNQYSCVRAIFRNVKKLNPRSKKWDNRWREASDYCRKWHPEAYASFVRRRVNLTKPFNIMYTWENDRNFTATALWCNSRG